MNQPKILFVVGPTAVGKTEVALCLAQKLQTEIISCDAMQVYREVVITSNKPAEKVLSQVKHHLVSVVSVTQEFDVASFRQEAVKTIETLLSQNKVPVISGGSGMYMQILLDGIFAETGRDEKTRRQLEGRVLKEGNEKLFAELQTVDPQAAAKIHLNDTRRIIRALEVYLTKQKPISQLQPDRQGLWDDYAVSVYVLNMDRDELYRRVDERVEQMFLEGIIEEIKKLENLPLSPTAERMIGIPEIRGYLRGGYDLERAKYLMKLNTRHLAKRQLTWFRKDKRFKWINIAADDSAQIVAEKILTDFTV